jgi:hypothetical protein
VKRIYAILSILNLAMALTAKRTAAGRSSWLEATSEVRVPINPCPARWVVPGGKSELWPDISCALAKMAIEEVKMKAAVTSDLAISSSC